MSDKVKTAFGMVTPAEEPNLLSQWAAEFQQRLLANIHEENRRWTQLSGVDPDNDPTTMEKRDLSPEYIAARKRFKKRWKRLVRRGLKLGYLEHEHCFECGGELKVTTETTEWVSVPNPDFDLDKPNPYAQPEGSIITIPTIGGTR